MVLTPHYKNQPENVTESMQLVPQICFRGCADRSRYSGWPFLYETYTVWDRLVAAMLGHVLEFERL